MLSEAEVRHYISDNLSRDIMVSSAEIARHFSNSKRTYTRNSVIAFCTRRGIQLPLTPNPQKKKKIHVQPYFFKKKFKREKLKETEDGVYLGDTDETHCREIIGYLRVCGKPIVRGSYCEKCARKNYV